MILAAFVLLVCTQEAQRSGKERDESVRPALQASPLPADGVHARDPREREEAERAQRREPLLDGLGRAHDSRARLGLDAGLVDWPEDRLHAGDDLGGAGSQLTFDLIPSTPEGHGLSLFASRSRFPEPVLGGLGADWSGGISGPLDDRIGIDGWLALGSGLELYGRAEQWSEPDDSGGTVRARAIWRDAFGAGGPFLLETYVDSGRSSSATGLRASGSKRFEFGAIGLSWDSTDYDAAGIDEKLLQHAVRADVDFALGRHWSLGVYAQSQFGDERDSLSFGFALQLGFD
jgi:hypothetical protein